MINILIDELLEADLALEVVPGGLSEEGMTEVSDFIQLSKLQKLNVDVYKIIDSLLKSTNLSSFEIAKTLGISETFVLNFAQKKSVV
jgi:uncharacterized protein YggL (DUF469 family)